MPELSNPRQEKFAQLMASGHPETHEPLTATAAYALAGYKPSQAHAARLAANGMVRERIAELQAAVAAAVVEETGISRARWLKEIERVAFADVRSLFDANDELLPVTMLSDDAAGAVQAVEFVELGGGGDDKLPAVVRKVRFGDKLKALDMIGRAQGFLADGQGGQPVNVAVFVAGPEREGYEAWAERKRREREAKLLERPR